MRHPDWMNRLTTAIETFRHEPFAWGKHDCALWASTALFAVYDVDPLKRYRGRYRSAKGALKFLRKYDKVKQPVELFDKYCNERREVVFAMPGSIIAAEPATLLLDPTVDPAIFGPVLGVCNGTKSYFVGPTGLVEFNTLQMRGHAYNGIRR